jgi:hypothetical protein
MFTIETNRIGRLVRFAATGFFDDAEAGRFRADLTSAIAKLTLTHGGFKILADLREIEVLPQSAVKTIQEQMQWTANNGVERSAALVSSVLQQMQIKRILPDDRFQCFTSEAAALHWLDL